MKKALSYKCSAKPLQQKYILLVRSWLVLFWILEIWHQESPLQVSVIKFHFPSTVKIFFLWNKYYFNYFKYFNFPIITSILKKFDGLDRKYLIFLFFLLYKRNYVSAHFQREIYKMLSPWWLFWVEISLGKSYAIMLSVKQLVSTASKQTNSRKFASLGKIYICREMRIVFHSSLQNKQIWYFYGPQKYTIQF